MKNLILRSSGLLFASGLLATPMRADVLELKNGTLLNGTFAGGTAGTVRFETGAGLQVIERSQVIALTFTTPATVPTPAAAVPVPTTAPVPAAAPIAAAAPAPAPIPAPVPRQVTLPSGTLLLVRIKDGISSKNAAGTPFATKLEYDLYSSGAKVIPAGTVIYGKVLSSAQARRAFGQSTLDLRLTQMALGGHQVALYTSGYTQAGERAIKDAARGAAAGAAIGAIVDGGDGAGTGAAIGATAGALKRGESITITPGTLIQFNLTQPCTVVVGG